MSNDNVITIDGYTYEFEASETILQVAQRNGIEIPTLCYLKDTTPTGACRICLVEVTGARNLLPSCSTPAAKDMVVNTKSPKVLRARRTIIEFLMISGNHNCAIRGTMDDEWTGIQKRTDDYNEDNTICDAYGTCRLQQYAYLYQVNKSRFHGFKPKYPKESESALILRNFSRCIQCGRCVQACNEIMVNRAISPGFRGAESKITAMGDQPLSNSDCVFCGECIRACPVGALVEKKNRDNIKLWDTKAVRTTCHHCGVGCQLTVHVKDNEIVRVTSDDNYEPNSGRLCFRGCFAYDFIHSDKRIKKPLIKENGSYKEASWDEALDLVAEKIREVKEKHGPDSIAGISSPKFTNEDLYVMQKFFRTAVGTNNITQTEKVAIPGAFMSNTFDEIEKASCIIILNSDITEKNPVAAAYVKRAVLKGSKLIVIDPEKTKISEHASLYLKVREGTENVLVNGLIQKINEGDKEEYSPESVAEVTGVSKEKIIQAADLISQSKPAVLIYNAENINSGCTVETLKNIPDCTINCISGNNNTQGACDMGMLPDYLPGYRKADDPDAVKKVEEVWNQKLDNKPGLGMSEIVENVSQGKVKLLYCAGDSVASTISDKDNIEFTIVQDMFRNENSNADVILPAAAWSEYDGTYTNSERRISRVRKAVDSPGESEPAWWIFRELASRIDQKWDYQSAQSIWDSEIVKFLPESDQFSYENIDEQGKIIPPAAETCDTIIVSGWNSASYNHMALIEECSALEDVLRPKDPREITNKFIAFCKEEDIEDKKQEIDDILLKYRKIPGGLIPVLQQIQKIVGFLPVVVQNYIAQGLNIPAIDVFGVVTFYAFFTMVPRGRHVVKVCLGTACFVLGSKNIISNLEKGLDIQMGETTQDRRFSLETVRCLGACGLAPVMVIGDDTHGQVDPVSAMNILEAYE